MANLKKVTNLIPTRFRKLIFLLVGILVVLAIIMLVRNNTNSTSGASRTITGTVSKGTIEKTISATGNLQAAKMQTGTFSSSSSSLVTEVDVKVGDTVSAGQVLAKIDDTTLRNSLLQSQSSLRQANNNLQNTLTKGKYTVYDIANLREQIKTAQTNVNTAQKNLDGATIKAEFAGLVVTEDLQVGNAASTSTVVVIDPNSLYVNVSLSEYDMINLKKDMPAVVTFGVLNNKSYIGKVTDIALSPTISSNVVTYTAKVAIVASDNNLNLGYSGKAVVTLASKDNTLMIPTAAVKTANDGSYYVQVQGSNNTLTSKPIEIGIVGDTQTEVTSGLAEGDKIVVSVVQTVAATTTQAANALQLGGGGGFGGNVTRTGTGGGNRTGN